MNAEDLIKKILAGELEPQEFARLVQGNSSLRAELDNLIPENVANSIRMAKGLAPIGSDDAPLHLHHWKDVADDMHDYTILTRTMHLLMHKGK